MAQIGESANDLTKKGQRAWISRKTLSGSRDSSTGSGYDHHPFRWSLIIAPGQRVKSDDVSYLSKCIHISDMTYDYRSQQEISNRFATELAASIAIAFCSLLVFGVALAQL
jgi:hypothetical protein